MAIFKHPKNTSTTHFSCHYISQVLASIIFIVLPFNSALSLATPITSVFINELHYDNLGSDTNEFIELVGLDQTDISGWSLVLYNGSTGRNYDSYTFSNFIFSDESDGFGFKSINFSSIQNGGAQADAVALADNNGNVIQFLSYEGFFTATSGVANGLLSEDIKAFESSSTPINHSLQLSGSGSNYSDFTWALAAPKTFSAANNQQFFIPANSSSNPQPSNSISVDEPKTGFLFLILLFLIAVKPYFKNKSHRKAHLFA